MKTSSLVRQAGTWRRQLGGCTSSAAPALPTFPFLALLRRPHLLFHQDRCRIFLPACISRICQRSIKYCVNCALGFVESNVCSLDLSRSALVRALFQMARPSIRNLGLWLCTLDWRDWCPGLPTNFHWPDFYSHVRMLLASWYHKHTLGRVLSYSSTTYHAVNTHVFTAHRSTRSRW